MTIDPDYNEPDDNIQQFSKDQIADLPVQLLHNNPEQFIDRTVTNRWDDGSTYEGCVVDIDDDNQGGRLFGVQWSDVTRSDLDINEMRKYCVLKSDGTKNRSGTRCAHQFWPQGARSEASALARSQRNGRLLARAHASILHARRFCAENGLLEMFSTCS